MGNHAKIRPKTRKQAFLLMKKPTRDPAPEWKRVHAILDHPKTTPENAHVFLTAMESHGFERTYKSMDKEGVDEKNIERVIQDGIKKETVKMHPDEDGNIHIG
jgi:hypothetical protein